MTDRQTIALVLGTRPEIIKLAPVLRELESRDHPYTLVHTGQHYSGNLSSVFFDQLNLDPPDYDLGVGSSSHGEQTGVMIREIEVALNEIDPAWVLVQGDTNSVLAGAIVTSKMDAKLGHIEAGLRSYDRKMPEEINRVLTDHASDHLFAPTESAAANLATEGITDRVTVTGNTVVDAVDQHADLATSESAVLERFEISPGKYLVLTAHRSENVDVKGRFRSIIEGVSRAADSVGFPVIYPVHPRAEERLSEFEFSIPENIRIVEPLDYLDFLHLEQHAAAMVTDSGGVQEESCILDTPCVTVRANTERPETVTVGANELVGVDPTKIATGVKAAVETDVDWENPFGDGTAAEQILDTLSEHYIVSDA
ncbi:non-hydrolyzing UDP-N-acetylglucosamine 2-epimerase [Halomicrobium sp. LC1Hm]|uniref:non-hydrolyzing UDP-N-acetylglucosamine 2-epimerase n=1 Tax=Halomicrobium sp. LC1Hm TaxID=2610902 RepID=UPI001298457E|nr:UDP-N-acetylglucosamine 2-epimerase (non-hydrolyzing) [Halomicrobium sp. LC1Hm]QGA81916.1 UDP-N-acetylglucosamine 2-epimerase (non-hydrolysing) [Halomicrobium sp. LC1Hm]